MSQTTVFATFDNADSLESALDVLRKNPVIAANPTLRVSTETGVRYGYGVSQARVLRAAFVWITIGLVAGAIGSFYFAMQSIPQLGVQALTVNALAWAVTGAVGGMLVWGVLDVLFSGSLDNREGEDESERTFVISAEVSDQEVQSSMIKLLKEQGALKLESTELKDELPVQLFD